MNWLGYALLAVAINTSLSIGLRLQTKQVANPRVTGLVYNCYAALTAVIIWIITGAQLPSNIPAWAIILLMLSAVGYGIFQRGQFYLRKHVEASELAPVLQAGILAGLAASVLILGESLTPKKLAGIIIILGGLAIIHKDTKLRVNKFTTYALFIASCLSVAGVIDKVASGYFPIYFYAMMIWLLPLPYIAVPVKRAEFTAATTEGKFVLPLLAGLNALSLVLLVKALQLGDATSVLPVMATTSIMTVISGVIFLREHKDWQIKLIAGILVTIGVIALR
jgi:drug/metabolite transporter (DMT)-like permease